MILFHRRDQNPEKLDGSGVVEGIKELRVAELTESAKGNTIVGIDTGKDDLLHCMESEVFYCSTAKQYRKQTKSKTNTYIIDDLQKESHAAEKR